MLKYQMMSTNIDETQNVHQDTNLSTRSLDIARNSSIDMAALNNKIVNMRSTIRKAKVRVIHKLTRNIEKIKKKNGSEKQLEKLKGKSQRFLEEIRVIKNINLDKVSKYALWNTSSWDEICKQPTSTIESRALTRLSECILIQDKVKAFRSCHSDWRDLAAYLMIKQSGRRYKKKKNRENRSTEVEHANIKARKTMTDTYLQHKLVDKEVLLPLANCSENSSLMCHRVTETQELCANENLNEEDELTIKDSTKHEEEFCKNEMVDESDKQSVSVKFVKLLLNFFPHKIEESDDSDLEESKSLPVSKCSKNNPIAERSGHSEVKKNVQSNLLHKDTSSSGDSSEEDTDTTKTKLACKDESQNDTSDEDSDVDDSIDNSLSSKNKSNSTKKSDSRVLHGFKNVETSEDDEDSTLSKSSEGSSQSYHSDADDESDEEDMARLCVKKQRQKHTEFLSKEMVVKKLCMQTFTGDIEDKKIDLEEEAPDILIHEEQVSSVKKKKRKDPFFQCSDVEEDDDGDDTDGKVSAEVKSEGCREHSDEELSNYEHLQKARHAFKSDFVDTLGSKGYRRYDWNSQRDEGSTRGRGRMNHNRGRMNHNRGRMSRGGGRYEGESERVDRFPRHAGGDGFTESWDRGRGNSTFQNSRRPGRGRPFDKAGGQSRPHTGHAAASSGAVDEVIHPSWEASKRRKEQATIHAYQGKKIKFND